MTTPTPSFGGLGPIAVPPPGATPFAVTASPHLTLAGDRTGRTSFTITNLTGRPVRARLTPRGSEGADDSWLAVDGPTEIPMGVAATVVVPLTVTVPEEAPAGQGTVQLAVVPEDDTEKLVLGQAVSFVVPPPREKPKVPWLIIAIVAALVLLVGGGVTYILLRSPAGVRNTEVPTVAGTASPARR